MKGFKKIFCGSLKNLKNGRIILDREKRLGGQDEHAIPDYRYDYDKENISRRYVFDKKGNKLKFLDVGCRDARLTYLLGIESNLKFNEKVYKSNLSLFRQKYEYYGLDLEGEKNRNILVGDICSHDFLLQNSYEGYFDVIYSNNVFEHLRKPWVASRNLLLMLKKGGIIITIAPFSIRYHKCPDDYFRYTHNGLSSLFLDCGNAVIKESGYDIRGRRNDWRGSSTDDACPLDKFGGWRENWFVVSIIEKI